MAGKLYKVARAGGPPVVLRDSLPQVNSGAWTDRDVILLGTESGLFRVDPSGGPGAKLDDQPAESPAWLPGRRYLYVRRDGIFAGSLDGGKPVRLLADKAAPVYVPAAQTGSHGYLLFVRGQTLVAQAFNADKLQLQGEAIAVQQHVGNLGSAGAFTASANGTLIFGHGDASEFVLTWLDRAGRELQPVSKPVSLLGDAAIRLSPDDSKAIVPVTGDNKTDLWMADLNRKTLSQFTFQESWSAVWSPDGRKVLWADNNRNRYVRPADGSGKDELLYQDPKCGPCFPTDWSSDGKLITFAETGESGLEIWLVPTAGDRRPYPYFQGHASAYWGQFSPDNRWMAYAADQFPQPQIFVESVPAGRSRRQVSHDGGDWPIWRRDGKELFYCQGPRIMAVPIRLKETSVENGEPRALFDVPRGTRFQVSRDGQRFLIALPADSSAGLTVDTDWRAGLGK